MSDFAIHSLAVGGGLLALGPMPGRGGAYSADFAVLRDWGPALVVTMTTAEELAVPEMAADLAAAGIDWAHLPITDFGTPAPETEAKWPALAAHVHGHLARGARVFIHCMGGCGRSGMAVLRLMIEAGEGGGAALARLRAVRPCAVETEAQRLWAISGRPSSSRV